MSEFIFKLPDLGEGMVEAEIIEWHVKPGDEIEEGQIIVDVMTDKANIEVPAPASGRVLRTSGQAGDMVTVGTELIAIETGSRSAARAAATAPIPAPAAHAPARTAPLPKAAAPPAAAELVEPAVERAEAGLPEAPSPRIATPGRRVLASPALRRLANERGIDLSAVAGSGPRGRILRRDVDALGAGQAASATAPVMAAVDDDVTEVRVIGVRRMIAERMQAAKREIPHFAYVEEVDVTALERLRQKLNERDDARKLTFLPFISLALIRSLKDFPQCNAHYDAERGVLRRFARVHLGIATQTPDGLKVPVVRNADGLDLHALGGAIAAAAEQARDGTASRENLTGSTITLTSLGRLGGIASTPIINAPEMGVIGVNKAVERPMVIDGRIEIRLMMNLSSSFDHRFVDGFDAASMIQAMKTLLEEPALLFV